jgi:hypothetical protein
MLLHVRCQDKFNDRLRREQTEAQFMPIGTTSKRRFQMLWEEACPAEAELIQRLRAQQEQGLLLKWKLLTHSTKRSHLPQAAVLCLRKASQEVLLWLTQHREASCKVVVLLLLQHSRSRGIMQPTSQQE